MHSHQVTGKIPLCPASLPACGAQFCLFGDQVSGQAATILAFVYRFYHIIARCRLMLVIHVVGMMVFMLAMKLAWLG